VAESLDTQHHPDATFTLTEPLTVDPSAGTGATISGRAVGRLTLRGVSRPVTFTIAGRQDGETLQASGALPISFADWEIPGPTGYGPLGSLADHGTAEFLVILHHD
jgi:polyisoprenoid-binding protein YceI